MSRFLAVAVCAAVLLCACSAYAVTMKSNNRVTIAQDQPIDDDLLVAGKEVVIRSGAQGDVTAAGSMVTVSGPVAGSVLASGGQVSVTGSVGNDAYLAGGTVAITSSVADNAYLAGGMVVVDEDATVGSDLIAAGRQLRVLGDVAGDAKVSARDLVIGGTVDGSVYANADTVRVLDGAIIRGDLRYTSPNRARISPGARIAGGTVHTMTPKPRFAAAFLTWLWWLLAIFVYGVVLVLVFPHRTQAAADTVLSAPGISAGVGILALIVVPIAVTIVAITLIGIPVALVALVIYAILLFSSTIFVGLAIGRWALGRFRPNYNKPIIAMGIGVLALSILGLIPFIGWLVKLIVLIMGLGAFLISWWRDRQHGRAEVPGAMGAVQPEPGA